MYTYIHTYIHRCLRPCPQGEEPAADGQQAETEAPEPSWQPHPRDANLVSLAADSEAQDLLGCSDLKTKVLDSWALSGRYVGSFFKGYSALTTAYMSQDVDNGPGGLVW